MSQENVTAAGVCSATRDVRALAPVAVMTGDVPATVVDAADRGDPEVGVSKPPVPGQGRRPASDIEAVVSGPGGGVSLQQADLLAPETQSWQAGALASPSSCL